VCDDRYRFSFETVAEQYERARPPYADEAVSWAARRLGIGPGTRVLDLAAGTGKLTRQLLALGADVVAVEPGSEMRAVLRRVLPQVETLAGRAEEIPLPDDSVDAITVGQAFHWFDARPALAEMHRVLRPGGGFALFWNRWDEEDPLLGAVEKLLAPIRPVFAERPDVRGPFEQRSFRRRRPMTVDALVEWAASTSGFINAPREEQARIAREIRRLASGYAGEVLIRTDVVLVS
jgi:ubiquinone/menaquinone biosynthesis C-methylase UbiE